MKRSIPRSLPQDDPVLVATVERALKPYEKILSPSMLEHFRSEALLQLSANPYAVALVKQIKKPAAVAESDTVPSDQVPSEDEKLGSSSGTGRHKREPK